MRKAPSWQAVNVGAPRLESENKSSEFLTIIVGKSYDHVLGKDLIIRPFFELSEYITSEYFTIPIRKCTIRVSGWLPTRRFSSVGNHYNFDEIVPNWHYPSMDHNVLNANVLQILYSCGIYNAG
jgi:hypothetical protein